MRRNIRNIVVVSKKLSPSGILLAGIIIVIAIYIASITNPFSTSLPRILYSAVVGGIGGGIGAGLAYMLGLTKPSE